MEEKSKKKGREEGEEAHSSRTPSAKPVDEKKENSRAMGAPQVSAALSDSKLTQARSG